MVDIKKNAPKKDKNQNVKVKMLQNAKGAKDGVTLEDFEKDKEYDLPEKLAKDFESIGAIERLKAEEGDKFVLGEKVEGTEFEGGNDSQVLGEAVGENLDAGKDEEGKEKAMSSKSVKAAPKNKAAKPEGDK